MLVIPIPQHTAVSTGENAPLPSSVTLGTQAITKVAELHIQPAAGNFSYLSVYDVATGIVLKDLEQWEVGTGGASGGQVNSFSISCDEGNSVEIARYGVTFAHTGDKWNVYVVIR